MPVSQAREWIDHLGLLPHPEGGFYRESYRAHESIDRTCLPERFTGPRVFSTAIYFLLTSDTFSALHTLRQDEVWHHYAGATLTIHVIDPQGVYTPIQLGTDIASGALPQAVVPAGHLFGASVEIPDAYALVGCTVAPGFDFDDFVLPTRSELLDRFSHLGPLIARLTR